MIILWFSYPVTQALIMEILMYWEHLEEVSDSLHNGTPQKRRDELQADWNRGKSEIRVLAASMQCGGVGLNFQHDSHVCMLFEAASTLDMELQIIIIPWILWFLSGTYSLQIALMLFASTAGWERELLEISTLSSTQSWGSDRTHRRECSAIFWDACKAENPHTRSRRD
jgi:hypothetical protein